MIEAYIRDYTLTVSLVVEGIAALIVTFAVAEAIVRLLLNARFRQTPVAISHAGKEQIRLRLGRWLALALELLLGADIMRTAVAPSWSDIGKLAAIAAVRTALNFFLQREIDGAAAREALQAQRSQSSGGGAHGLNDGGESLAERAAS
ncbi:MAG: DUF1622 domain-containing protein [Sphingomonadaceae bacterium]